MSGQAMERRTFWPIFCLLAFLVLVLGFKSNLTVRSVAAYGREVATNTSKSSRRLNDSYVSHLITSQ